MGTFAWDREVTGTSLAYPGDAPPLSPGGTYLWKVDPVSPLLGPPPPAAMIVVLAARNALKWNRRSSQISGTVSMRIGAGQVLLRPAALV
jgi:hypothetical protein